MAFVTQDDGSPANAEMQACKNKNNRHNLIEGELQ
jgi:hypothetical protein